MTIRVFKQKGCSVFFIHLSLVWHKMNIFPFPQEADDDSEEEMLSWERGAKAKIHVECHDHLSLGSFIMIKLGEDVTQSVTKEKMRTLHDENYESECKWSWGDLFVVSSSNHDAGSNFRLSSHPTDGSSQLANDDQKSCRSPDGLDDLLSLVSL